MSKFIRNYFLQVERRGRPGQYIDFDYSKKPFTLEFDITHNTFGSASVASIRIYNLSEDTRESIRKDQINFGERRNVRLLAGYNSSLYTIFDGDIYQAWSVREGVNIVTQIESFDGGFANVNAQIDPVRGVYPAGTQTSKIITDFINTLSPYGIQLGKVGAFTTVAPIGNSYTGNTLSNLRELCQGGFFIFNSKAYALNDFEATQGILNVIDSASGLLGTPVRQDSTINFDIVFEPRLQMGQALKLVSRTEKVFNGTYKVISLKHKGIISPNVSGQAVTSIGVNSPIGFKVI